MEAQPQSMADALDLAVPRSKWTARKDWPRPVDLWDFFGSPFMGLRIGERAAATEDEPNRQQEKDEKSAGSRAEILPAVRKPSPQPRVAERFPVVQKPSPSPRRAEITMIPKKGLVLKKDYCASSKSWTIGRMSTEVPTDRLPGRQRRPTGIVVDDNSSEETENLIEHPSQHQSFGRKTLWRRSKKFARSCVSRAARKVGLGSD